MQRMETNHQSPLQGPTRLSLYQPIVFRWMASASSDPDGTISEWLWTKISGPASFNITNPRSAKTVVKNLDAGIYQFELKVTDNGGLSAKDTIQVIVNDPCQPKPTTGCQCRSRSNNYFTNKYS